MGEPKRWLYENWGGRLEVIAMLLGRYRRGPLSNRVRKKLDEAFFSVNAAQMWLYEETIGLEKRRKSRGKKAKP